MKNIIFLLAVSLLTGCATPPHKPVAMEQNYLQQGTKKVGVIMTEMPRPDVHLPGADCLLCIVAAEIGNSTLSSHVDTLIPDDFKLIESDLVKQLKAKKVDVVAIEDNLKLSELSEFNSDIEGAPRHDYRKLSNKYGINHLLVIDINTIGMLRKYSSYIPIDDPRAVVTGVSYLVDLSNNTFKWYKHINVNKSANGNWDEPPAFPALTNAYYQAIETGRETILAEF